MRKTLQLIVSIVSFFFLTTVLLQAQPVINAATPNNTTIGQYEKFELTIDLTATYTNPYDYSDIVVSCSFKSPGGNTLVADGFYMQDYTLNTGNGSITVSGPGAFRVRFTPTETGTWEYTLSCTTQSGSVTQAVQTFQCTASATPGFIRKNATNYLNFDDGSQYIPVGENMCWYNSNAYTDYTNWLNKLTDNKGNFIRLWMPAWALGIEWKSGFNGFGGLMQYKQTSAYYLDWLLDYCRQKGVYAMLCLLNHGTVSTNVNPEWNDNPYNAANGGPCTNTWDFFTNTTAKDFIKNRFRYIVARYGYSRNIMSWELFNEVEWTNDFDNHKADITGWHDEMAQYIKSIDVYDHLLTTSYAHSDEDPDTWNLASMDITQTHYYVNTPNLETVIASGEKEYLAQYGKPTLNGEFGLGPGGGTLSTTDPNGVHIHNAIWASAFSGGMGTAMTWWWDSYIEPRNLYPHYKPLSELLASLPLKDENYKKASASVTGGGMSDITISPGANFGASTDASFTVDAGSITPGPTRLGSYLYGNSFNTQYRNPPSFTVNYPVAGQFKVITGNSTGQSPKINIYLDGVEKLNQNAAINATYTIDVPAGNHVIKVDNLGTDWIFISGYVFTNIGSPLNVYTLKNEDTTAFAGWVHNKEYNWKYLQDNSGTPPAAISGANIIVQGIADGMYAIQFINCTTGAVSSTATASTTGNALIVPLPDVSWDLAITATRTGVTGIVDLPFARQLKIYPNPVSSNNLFIQYELTRQSGVLVELYTLTGCKLKTIYSGTQQAGLRTIQFPFKSGIGPATGIYLVRVQIGKDFHLEKIVF